MPSPMAFCPVHGLFQALGAIQISGGASVRITNSMVSCPRCGRDSEILPGTYTESNNQLKYLLDPSISPEALKALLDIAERLQRSEITPQEAVQQAAQIDPAFGGLIAKMFTFGLPTIALLVSLISLHLQREDGKETTQFYQQAIEALTRQVEAVENISKEVERGNRVKSKGDRPAKVEAAKKLVTVKPPSKRRHNVNDERRRKLIEHRKDFPRGR
ncbi:hypothetical protein NKI46_11880 [Mesorhizobium sp. M0615]|uniref:hypothetical protein n=1 Tax=Mesorhizobium sp. M0615 TaxID=2956971 RepID=UPI00333C0EB9